MLRLTCLALLGIIEASSFWPLQPKAANIPDRCPALILRRVGGLGTESQGGVVLALWESGAMLRAESSKRPFGSHILGHIERADVTRILGIVKQSALWTMRSKGVALDMPADELELQQADGRIGWAETPGVTGTKELAELRDTLFKVRMHESVRIARPVQENWNCPTVRWSR